MSEFFSVFSFRPKVQPHTYLYFYIVLGQKEALHYIFGGCSLYSNCSVVIISCRLITGWHFTEYKRFLGSTTLFMINSELWIWKMAQWVMDLSWQHGVPLSLIVSVFLVKSDTQVADTSGVPKLTGQAAKLIWWVTGSERDHSSKI